MGLLAPVPANRMSLGVSRDGCLPIVELYSSHVIGRAVLHCTVHIDSAHMNLFVMSDEHLNIGYKFHVKLK